MEPSLTDPRADARTQSLYRLLTAEQGKRILLAQQECPGRFHHEMEMEHILRMTGDLPAVRGLDFIHNDFDGVVDRALRWNDKGGVVTVCWHTGVEGIGYPESKAETPDFDALLTPGTDAHRLLLDRWDAAAKALDTLQHGGVPVLWRPFHEFDGQWFWWGKGGGAAFIALWRLMRRVFTEEYGLHNLIWVLGYADDVRAGWYPGSEHCDVLGADTYRGVTVQRPAWDRLKALDGAKPLAFHECGVIPPVDAFFENGAVWSWIMPWHSRSLLEGNPPDALRVAYGDPRTVTLSRVGSF